MLLDVAKQRDQTHATRRVARACVVAALDWARESGADSVSLHATADGESLYRGLGFVDTTYTELRLRW